MSTLHGIVFSGLWCNVDDSGADDRRAGGGWPAFADIKSSTLHGVVFFEIWCNVDGPG